MKNSLIEIKNNLQGNKSRVDEAENQMNDLDHKETKKQATEQGEEKRTQKNEGRISSLWDNSKRSNIHIIGVPEGEEKEREIGNLLERIMKKTSLIW